MVFHPLEKLHLLHDGYQKAFRINGLDLLLIQDEGRTVLIQNRCPHMEAPLTYGQVSQCMIRCPMHRIEFSLRDGQARAPGRLDPLKFYPPVYEGNMVGVVI